MTVSNSFPLLDLSLSSIVSFLLLSRLYFEEFPNTYSHYKSLPTANEHQSCESLLNIALRFVHQIKIISQQARRGFVE